MIGYGKMSGCAISALSALAEHYPDPSPLSSLQIAELRNYPQTLVAKVMTTLSTAGLVTGSRGPGGGYLLARQPQKICLIEIVRLFEGTKEALPCPYGPGHCGSDPPCPMHEQLNRLREEYLDVLEDSTLGVFAEINDS